MRVGAALVVVLAAACGRYGFDPIPAGSTSVFTPIKLPPGGAISEIERAPDGTLYVVGDEQSIASSTDDGMTWTGCATGPRDINQVAIDANGGVAVATEEGLQVSTDGCMTWVDLGLGLGASSVVAGNGHLLVGTAQGLYAFDGTSWSQPGFSGQFISQIAATPAFDHIYVATGGYGVAGVGIACSTDGGATFPACNTGLDGLAAEFIVVDPNDPSRVFAQVSSGIYAYALDYTTDGGATWQTSDTSGGQAVTIDPADEQFVLWDSWGAGLEASSDGGGSYDGIDHRDPRMFDSEVNHLAYGPSSQVFAATDRGVFAAPDHNLGWLELDTGLDFWEIGDIAVSPTGAIYLATTAGVLISNDHGATWVEQIGGFDAISRVHSVAQSPTAAGTMFAAADNLLLRSQNGGDTFATAWTFTALENYHANRVRQLASGELLVATWGTVATSLDGTTFTSVSVDGAVEPINDVVALDAAGKQLVAATEYAGVYVSNDGGATWVASNTGLADATTNCLAVLPDGSLLVGTSDNAFHAASPTGPWSPANLPGLDVFSLLVANGLVLAGTQHGVFTSPDGATWTRLPGLGDTYVSALAVGPDGDLLVGTYGHGLYRTPFP